MQSKLSCVAIDPVKNTAVGDRSTMAHLMKNQENDVKII